MNNTVKNLLHLVGERKIIKVKKNMNKKVFEYLSKLKQEDIKVFCSEDELILMDSKLPFPNTYLV